MRNKTISFHRLASPNPKDTIYTNMESLMQEVRTTKKKTATYYLVLKDDDKDVKVRIDLKQIDCEIPIYKSESFDVKKLMALKEEALTEPNQKLKDIDAKSKEWNRLTNELKTLTKERDALKADTLSLDSTAIAKVEEDLQDKMKDFKKVDAEVTKIFKEYEAMMDSIMGNLRTQYKKRLVAAMEEAYDKIENKETTFKSVDDDAHIWDIRLYLLKIDATREMKIPRRLDGGGETTEQITAGKLYYLLHFAEFGSMFEEEEVKRVFSTIKLWEFHLNPYLVDKQFGLVCDDRYRTQHYINSVVDYKNYKGSLESTANIPKPGDPLVNMKIADPGGGKDGGLHGCTRSSGACSANLTRDTGGSKAHKGIDLYAEQDTKLYSMYDGVVIDFFDKVERDEYFGGKGKMQKRYSKKYVGSLGNDVQIQSSINDKIVIIRYCHLNKILVKKGEKVKQGQHIGFTGRNGNAGKKEGKIKHQSNEPHVHIQIQNNTKIDPMDYLTTKFDDNGNKIDK
ncbi:MAG: peptidoglycan DD-metalloendopeptidase family protein [Flagellimonas sp.]